MYIRTTPSCAPVQILKRKGAQSMRALKGTCKSDPYTSHQGLLNARSSHQVLHAIACREVYW